MNLHLHAGFLKAEIDKLLAAYPELAEDETLRADMLAGETDIERVIEQALSERQEAETMASAIKEREGSLAERRKRFERKSDALRKLILSLMGRADLDRLTLPEATLSITAPKVSVSITELDDIPQGYFKTVKQPDKTAIKKAWDAGEEIPGTALVLGDEGLTIRSK